MNYFSSNLKYLLKRFYTTQAELASYIGKSQNSISNWINEISTPDVGDLIKINQFFGISIDALIFIDLKNGKIITNEHVEEFKRVGKHSGEHLGKVKPISKAYFVDIDGLKTAANLDDPVSAWAIMGQIKQLFEKLEQLRIVADKILKNSPKKSSD